MGMPSLCWRGMTPHKFLDFSTGFNYISRHQELGEHQRRHSDNCIGEAECSARWNLQGKMVSLRAGRCWPRRESVAAPQL
jgi:hypothetical protein